MQTIVPDGQPECPNGETCYLLLSIATLHRYMMFRIGFSTVVLTWFDNLMLWKKSGEKPSPQCTVYSSKIVSYDLAGDASALGWWKNKTLTVLGGRFWKLGTEVHFLEGWSRVKHVEALTLEDLRLGIQLIWTSDVQQVGRGLLCGLIIFCLKTYDPARLAASHCLFLTSLVPGTVLSSKGEGARHVRWQKSHAFFRSCKQ